MTIRMNAGDAVGTRFRGILATARRASFTASSTLSHLAAFGLVTISVATALVVAPRAPVIRLPAVTPQNVAPEGPRNPLPVTGTHGATESKAKPPPDTPVPAPATVPPETAWPLADVEAAASICTALLQSSGMQYAMLQPIKHGQCGTPSPISLSSVDDTKVTLSPPVTINCPLAAALDTWVKKVLQPAALEIFGSRVVRLADTSSYVCRNRNGEALGSISEHAFANAFDVAGFVLADKRVIEVREWGTLVRDRAVGVTASGPAVAGAADSAKIAMQQSIDPHILFLKRIHDEGCRIFGTVLGPEANEAHREHLHFDLKTRRGKSYCQ